MKHTLLALGLVFSMGIGDALAQKFDYNAHAKKSALKAKEKKEKKKAKKVAAKKAQAKKEAKKLAEKKEKAKEKKEKEKQDKLDQEEISKAEGEFNDAIAKADFSPSAIQKCLAGLAEKEKFENKAEKLQYLKDRKNQIELCKSDKIKEDALAQSEKDKEALAQKEEAKLKQELLELQSKLSQKLEAGFVSSAAKQCFQQAGVPSIARPRQDAGASAQYAGPLAIVNHKLRAFDECNKNHPEDIKPVVGVIPPRQKPILEAGEAAVLPNVNLHSGGKPQFNNEPIAIAPIGKPQIKPEIVNIGEVAPVKPEVGVLPSKPLVGVLPSKPISIRPAELQPVSEIAPKPIATRPVVEAVPVNIATEKPIIAPVARPTFNTLEKIEPRVPAAKIQTYEAD